MPTLPAPNSGSEFAPPPAGTFPAICYRVIDLGRQRREFNGDVKVQHQVMISWEIADEDERMSDGRPFTVSKFYTWSMHEKANLRKDLEAWRGAAFKETDFGPSGFDIRRLIGVPCLLSLVHHERQGSTYTNVQAVSKMPKNMVAAPLVNPTCFVWLEKDEFEQAAFDGLSERLKTTIMSSPEYALLKGDIPMLKGGNTITSGVDQLKRVARAAAPDPDDAFDVTGLEIRG